MAPAHNNQEREGDKTGNQRKQGTDDHDEPRRCGRMVEAWARLLQTRIRCLTTLTVSPPTSRTQRCGSSCAQARGGLAPRLSIRLFGSNGRWHLGPESPSLPPPQTPSDRPQPGSLALGAREIIPVSAPRAWLFSRLSSSVVSVQMRWPLIMPVLCGGVHVMRHRDTRNMSTHTPELGKSRMPRAPPLKYAAG